MKNGKVIILAILAFAHLDDKIHSAVEHGLNVLGAKNDKNQQVINYLINFD